VQGNGIVARIEGIGDRDQAAELNGRAIAVPRAALPPLAAGEFYRADLFGWRVVNLQGQELGVLDHFVDSPAHALMVVRGTRERWIPVTSQHLRRIVAAGRQIEVDWLADED